MGLPIQTAPTYTCKLSTGIVKFRPFLVKEQKYLLVARESEDNLEILEAVKNIITNVTNGEVDADMLPIYDLEFLFLNIRAKSVGETSTILLNCSDEECRGNGQVDVDLSTVTVVGDHKDNKVMLSDELGVMLRFPSTSKLAELESIEDLERQGLEMVAEGIESIFDLENVYEADDISAEELKDFIESLTLDQLELLSDWFGNVPSVSKEVSYTCNVCSKESTRTLTGLSSFF
jgi:hypothetical protein|tara:strand:+ start:502 stop:1200 length:699 start_codon:yes stop_codon:yes gene_type:complete